MRDNNPPVRRHYGLLSPFAWAGRSIARPLGIPEIRAQARAIRDLHCVLRSRGAGGGPALLLGPDRRFDLEASAEVIRLQAAEALDQGRITMEHYAQLGAVQVEELAILLQRRRIETAGAARLNLAIGAAFAVAGLWRMLGDPAGHTGPVLLLAWLGLCSWFLVRAVQEAQTNWQIRTGRMGSLREFLETNGTWVPS